MKAAVISNSSPSRGLGLYHTTLVLEEEETYRQNPTGQKRDGFARSWWIFVFLLVCGVRKEERAATLESAQPKEIISLALRFSRNG